MFLLLTMWASRKGRPWSRRFLHSGYGLASPYHQRFFQRPTLFTSGLSAHGLVHLHLHYFIWTVVLDHIVPSPHRCYHNSLVGLAPLGPGCYSRSSILSVHCGVATVVPNLVHHCYKYPTVSVMPWSPAAPYLYTILETSREKQIVHTWRPQSHHPIVIVGRQPPNPLQTQQGENYGWRTAGCFKLFTRISGNTGLGESVPKF